MAGNCSELGASRMSDSDLTKDVSVRQATGPKLWKKKNNRPGKRERALLRKENIAPDLQTSKMGTIGSPPNTRGQQEAQIPRNDATKELSNPRNEQEGFIARNKGSKKPSSTEKQKIGPNPSKRNRTTSKGAANQKTAWMMKGTGEVLHTVFPESIRAAATRVSSYFGYETLCSYNWQNSGEYAFLVSHISGRTCPTLTYGTGGPPKWVPQPLPTTLCPDSGWVYNDQNASLVPKYPFEPAFRALGLMNPDIQLDRVDIVANRNSLRKLLDFAAGKQQDPFCMGLHMVKDTLFISRKERRAQYMIHGAPNSGYGHNMEKAFTVPIAGLDKSTSHHRVIRYRLGDLDCVVRFEVDAYYEDDNNGGDTTDGPNSRETATVDIDELARAFAQLTTPAKGATKVVPRGVNICSSKLAEVKARKSERLNDAMPQLWFGRTPYLITGQHVGGVVKSVRYTHAKLRFEEWETANQEKLCKLVAVLSSLKNALQHINERTAVLVRDQRGGPLRILSMKNETSVLPEDLLAKFWGG